MKQKILIMIVRTHQYFQKYEFSLNNILRDRSFLYLDCNGSVAKSSWCNQLINDVSLDNDVDHKYLCNV